MCKGPGGTLNPQHVKCIQNVRVYVNEGCNVISNYTSKLAYRSRLTRFSMHDRKEIISFDLEKTAVCFWK